MSADDQNKTFATAVNCMDGRVQERVTAFTRERFGADWVDMVTEAGAVANINQGVRMHVKISAEAHSSKGLVVAAHSECAGNPVDDEVQKHQCVQAAELLKADWPELEVVPIWVPLDGEIELL